MREQLDPTAQISDGPYDLQCVQSFRDALTWMTAITYDVYVVDVDVAGHDPEGFIRSVRTGDGDALIISISSSKQLAATTLDAGADLFLPRGKAVSELRLTVSDLLDQKEFAGRTKTKSRQSTH